MELSGSLADNVEAALRSAKRLSGQPVYADTLRFWTDLAAHAEAAVRELSSAEAFAVERLLSQLRAEIVNRQRR